MKTFFSHIKSFFLILSGLLLILLGGCRAPVEPHLPKEDIQNHPKEDIQSLPDDKLFETVYFQMLDLVDSFANEDAALSQISPAQRTVYILSIYDMEMQNGGLCQFFVNSSRSLAPYVEESLKTVGAEEHCQLFTAFVADNRLDLQNLDSFRVTKVEDYIAQNARYDFDTFNNSYYKLPPLQDTLITYIKANISEFDKTAE